MSTVRDDGSTVEQDRVEGRGPGDEAPTGSGDLEFDEAWRGAATDTDVQRARDMRDPNPSFEDPNDR